MNKVQLLLNAKYIELKMNGRLLSVDYREVNFACEEKGFLLINISIPSDLSLYIYGKPQS